MKISAVTGVILLSAACTVAAQSPPKPAGEAWAVVIGINRYQSPRVPPLRYAVSDARSVETALRAQGFAAQRITVLLENDATKSRIETVLGDELKQRVGREDRVLVFFAGHGVTDTLRSGEEEGYLLPVDGDPDRLFGSAISMSALRQISDRLPARQILYVVDACYSGFAAYNRSIATGLLDEMVKRNAIQILTAGRKGDQSQEKAGHGVFTEVLLRGLQGDAFGGKSWVSLEELGIWMKHRVFAESNQKQMPQYGNLSGEGQFVFYRKALGTLALSGALAGTEIFIGDKRVGELQPGRSLVTELEPGSYKVSARKAGHREWRRDVQVLADGKADVRIDLEALGPAPVLRGDDGAEMVLVPAGPFWMGTTDEEAAEMTRACIQTGDTSADCTAWMARAMPRHRVTLDAFYIDRTLVTNAAFARFADAAKHRTTAEREGAGYVRRRGTPMPVKVDGASWKAPGGPGTSADPTRPVVQVSWLDASAYCKWAGKRLPTEAEWEKAARGTDERRFPWGQRWEPSNANAQWAVAGTSAVGAYPDGASPYGALDMAGNVWQHVDDWFDEAYYRKSPESNPKGPDTGARKSLRGGAWYTNWWAVRSPHRGDVSTQGKNDYIGFRCARSAQ